MTAFDEERIASLLRLLEPPPEAWTRAAQELPTVRHALDGIVARAEADAAVRQRVLADLQQAVASAGVEPTPAVVEQLRRMLAES